MTELPWAVIPEVVARLRETVQTLTQLIASESIATEFSRRWKNQACNCHSKYRWDSLRKVTSPKNTVTGALRLASEDDIATVRKWAPHYAREVGTRVDLGMLFELRLKRGVLHLWDDGGPRCLLTASGLTPGAARISSPYTPPEF